MIVMSASYQSRPVIGPFVSVPWHNASWRNHITDLKEAVKVRRPAIPSNQAELVTKEEFVTRSLRELVISGKLAPGTRLRQQQLAADFRVSATPVREALHRLVSEGYLQSE